MTLLSRKTDYALLILQYLHHHPEGGSAREVAAAFGLSRAFVANILKLLCHQGFVSGRRGVKGGYVLVRSVDEIRLADLLDAVDDAVHLAECNKTASGSACALLALCPLKYAIGEVHARIREVLRNVTLGELFRPAPATTPTEIGLILGTAGVHLAQ
jgi:Rrf2 family protein